MKRWKTSWIQHIYKLAQGIRITVTRKFRKFSMADVERRWTQQLKELLDGNLLHIKTFHFFRFLFIFTFIFPAILSKVKSLRETYTVSNIDYIYLVLLYNQFQKNYSWFRYRYINHQTLNKGCNLVWHFYICIAFLTKRLACYYTFIWKVFLKFRCWSLLPRPVCSWPDSWCSLMESASPALLSARVFLAWLPMFRIGASPALLPPRVFLARLRGVPWWICISGPAPSPPVPGPTPGVPWWSLLPRPACSWPDSYCSVVDSASLALLPLWVFRKCQLQPQCPSCRTEPAGVLRLTCVFIVN